MAGQITTILGAQWGDEGKGKLVDILSEKFDIVARATGGANAGHSVYVGDKKYVFHLLPSGVLHPQTTCVIGNGVVLHVPTFFEELQNLKERGIDVENRVKISDRVTLLFDYHKVIDGLQEDSKGGKMVGTTRRGIGPAYADKINRTALRLCDIKNWDRFEGKFRANLAWQQKIYSFDYDCETELQFYRNSQERLLKMMVDGAVFLNGALAGGKNVLLEGANAALLDIDHGTYPFVTSSNASIGGVFTGTGMAPKYLGENIGIMKAYITRVGSGPFPTELNNDIGEKIRKIGNEFGSTTGRPRRCGWFDVPLAKYAVMINGYTCLNLTKLDVLDELAEIKVAVSYRLDGEIVTSLPASLEDFESVEVIYESMPGWMTSLQNCNSWATLPINAQKYVLRIEELAGCPIKYIGVGQRRDQMIIR